MNLAWPEGIVSPTPTTRSSPGGTRFSTGPTPNGFASAGDARPDDDETTDDTVVDDIRNFNKACDDATQHADLLRQHPPREVPFVLDSS
jgi:hypothetical protein